MQVNGYVKPAPAPDFASSWCSFPRDRSPGDARHWFPGHPVARAAPLPGRQGNSDHSLVLRFHQQYTSGLTDFELAELAGRAYQSLGKRRGELRDAGYIRSAGLKRPSPTGAPATVWLITTKGRITNCAHFVDITPESKAS